MSFWIAAASLPLVGALLRYAVSYGYRGVSRRAALGEAWRVGVMLIVIVELFVIVVMVRT